MLINNVMALTHGLQLAHLGGDDAVVGVTLRDVGLSSRRGFFMPDVHRPTVHPDLLPHTLMERETYTVDINSSTGTEKKNWAKSHCSASVMCFLTIHNLLTILS